MRTSLLAILFSTGCAFITKDEYAHRLSTTAAPECAFTSLYYADADGDGFGNPDVFMEDCAAPEGTVDNADDCDDGDATAFPGAVWAVDEDGDGYGSMDVTVESCLLAEGMSESADDCDDSDGLVNPGMEEDCSTEVDDDCSLSTNDPGAIGCTEWFGDADEDGFAGGEAQCLCEATASFYALESDDCADEDAAVHPNAVEVCNDGIDNNCDDEALGCGFTGETSAEFAATTISGVAAAGNTGADLLYTPDIDGDGSDDLLIGAYGDSALTIVSGAVSGEHTTAEYVRLTGVASERLTRDMVVPGDVDGDGVLDLMLGAPSAAEPGRPAAGLANVYFGPISATTDLTAPDVQMLGPHGNANFGRDLGHLGDFDGDGSADLLAGGINIKNLAASKVGAVYVALGPFETGDVIDGAETGDVDLIIYGSSASDSFGSSMVAMDDWSGDGLPDLIVSARSGDGGQGAVYGFESGQPISEAGELWSAESADVIIDGTGIGAQTGEELQMIEDVTGDGLADLLVGAPGRNLEGTKRGAVYLVSDLVSGSIDEIAMAQFHGAVDNAGFGQSLAGTGPLDGAGTLGIAIGAPTHDNRGAIHVYGAPFEDSITADMALGSVMGVGAGDGFGTALVGGVDYDGDGMFDLITSAATANGGQGQVLILLGGAL